MSQLFSPKAMPTARASGKRLRIGELAKATGVTVETLRYYEHQGLLTAPARGDNGYRYYSPENLERVHFILRAKAVGFTLKDIEELLSLEVQRESHTCQEVKDMAEAKLAEIEQRMSELARMREALSTLTDACCGGPMSAEHCTILSALAEGEVHAEHHHHSPDMEALAQKRDSHSGGC